MGDNSFGQLALESFDKNNRIKYSNIWTQLSCD